MVSEVLIIKGLNTYCPQELGASRVKILDDINLALYEKEWLGLVGETGAGKTVLINAIGHNLESPIYMEADELTLVANGQRDDLLDKTDNEMRAIWGKQMVFIPSNARERLNPIMTVGDQVKNIILANLDMAPVAAYEKILRIFEKVQMPDPKQNYLNYPHELSGGMAQRVILSIALGLSPTVLMADEPTMGLDVTIQRQVLDLFSDFLKKGKSSVILATRDLGIVANYCDRVAVMCNGQLVELTTVRDFFRNAAHPYSKYLLQAAFASYRKEERDLVKASVGVTKEQLTIKSSNCCRFVDRCASAQEICYQVKPQEISIDQSHQVRCHELGSK